ncbi:hypothetical protein P7K49_024465 [Saguinus oedipus]|uniref:Tyrosinase n=1 Tax=Saguinus oedipus TaxID=9490 RepID=A0ABQ9UPK1_SAGOE|nr:hypothetical protein P7K49_024465 [Saguinus oedipus]
MMKLLARAESPEQSSSTCGCNDLDEGKSRCCKSGQNEFSYLQSINAPGLLNIYDRLIPAASRITTRVKNEDKADSTYQSHVSATNP